MKRYTYPALLIPEDVKIWSRILKRFVDADGDADLRRTCLRSDRRDAEVMLWAQVETDAVAYHTLQPWPSIINVRGGGGALQRYGEFA